MQLGFDLRDVGKVHHVVESRHKFDVSTALGYWNTSCDSTWCSRSILQEQSTMTQIELESAKYMKNVMLEEKARWTKARNEKAVQDFTTFVFGLVAIGVGILAVQEQELWVPFVRSFFY